MKTIYTIHAAYDHSIVKTFEVNDDTAAISIELAEAHNDGEARRYYISNGVGVIAALRTRDGLAHQIRRDDYMKFQPQAAANRAAAGIPNY